MGQLAEVGLVLPLVAAFSASEDTLRRAREWCLQHWGPIGLQSPLFQFTETDYYRASMGEGLKKCFFAFEQLCDPAELASRKNLTNQGELEIAQAIRQEGPPGSIRRPINLDPGYLTESKLVLASTKDHAHRIYLGQGIYAEITLRYRQGRWEPWEWTYPDYRRADYHAFLDTCRSYLRTR
jgi:hypothetical protein